MTARFDSATDPVALLSPSDVMADRWTGWKSFPDDFHGEYIQAPIGPGLYEVCRSSTREQVAFGCTRNVAESLCDLLKPRGLRRWLSFRRGKRYDTGELEYRTWPTATLSDARSVVSLIRERHEAVMRKYTAGGRVKIT